MDDSSLGAALGTVAIAVTEVVDARERSSFLEPRTIDKPNWNATMGRHSAPNAAKPNIASAGMYSIKEFIKRSSEGRVCTHSSLYPRVCCNALGELVSAESWDR